MCNRPKGEFVLHKGKIEVNKQRNTERNPLATLYNIHGRNSIELVQLIKFKELYGSLCVCVCLCLGVWGCGSLSVCLCVWVCICVKHSLRTKNTTSLILKCCPRSTQWLRETTRNKRRGRWRSGPCWSGRPSLNESSVSASWCSVKWPIRVWWFKMEEQGRRWGEGQRHEHEKRQTA